MGAPAGSRFLISVGGAAIYENDIVYVSNGSIIYATQIIGVTGAGTQVLANLSNQLGVSGVAVVGSRVIFQSVATDVSAGTSTTVFGTDGTTAGTQALVTFHGVGGVREFALGGKTLLYTESYPTPTTSLLSVYGTDGTAAGTANLLNLAGTTGTSFGLPIFLAWVGRTAAFEVLETIVRNGSMFYETKIFVTDGTPGGTHLQWDLANTFGVTTLPSPLVTQGTNVSFVAGHNAAIGGLGVLESFAGTGLVTTTVHTTVGSLTTSVNAGTVVGNGSATLEISGTLAQVNQDLAALNIVSSAAGTGEVTVVASFNGVSSPTERSTVTVAPPPPPVTFGGVAFTDTGTANDHLTRNGAVVLSGALSDLIGITAVDVYSGATLLGHATIDNVNHAWRLALTLPDGSYGSLNVIARDNAGHSFSAATAQTIQVDTIAPAATFGGLLYSDTGIQGDRITSNGNAVFSGTASDNVKLSSVDVYSGQTLIGHATVNGNAWTLQKNLAQGLYGNLNIVAVDAAGNKVTVASSQTLRVDTTKPAIGFGTVSIKDTGIQGDHITNSAGVTLGGSVSDNISVTSVDVFDNTVLLGHGTVDGAGHWTLTTNLAPGNHANLNAVATDEAGNTSTAKAAQPVRVDTAAPAVAISAVSFTDTGIQGDRITNEGLLTISGTVSDDVTVSGVTVSNAGTVLGHATLHGATWTLSVNAGQGTYNSISATAIDEAGNSTAATTSQTVQVDTKAPMITFGGVSFVDTGVQGDHLTNNANVTFTGTVQDNVAVASVEVFNNTTSLGRAPVDGAGHWSLAAVLGQGTYADLNAVATDEAGNTAKATTAQSVKVDTAAPVPVIASETLNANGSVTLKGTSEANSKVSVLDGSTQLGTAAAAGDGTWSLTTAANFGNAVHKFTATATDAAGNAGQGPTTAISGSTAGDSLSGTSGNDLFKGNAGDDHFIFGTNFGHDIISDFQPARETIGFNHGVFTSVADVLGHSQQVGSSVVIADHAGDTLTLSGVTIASLHASDFFLF